MPVRRARSLWLSSSFALLASPAAVAEGFEAYGQFGTEGFGLGAGYHVTARQALRVEANTGSITRDFDAGDNEYEVSLDPRIVGLFYDSYPSANAGFRLSLGFALFKTEASGLATGDSVEIDGETYALGEGDALRAWITPERSTAPYVGLGWGRSLGRQRRWGFFADVGAYFTSYEGRIQASPALEAQVDAALEASGSSQTAAEVIAEEQRRVQDDVDDYRFYPVVKLGVSYHF